MVTSKLIKKVITKLDLTKVPGPDCIPVEVLKNCGSEFSYILVELFNMCLKKSCFPYYWKVSSVLPVFKNVEKGLQLKTTAVLVFFMLLVKAFKNL